jgi:uncharacterized protein YjiS (DUF1127 family)
MIMSTLTLTTLAHSTGSVPAHTGLISRLVRILTIRRERRALMALDDRMLADVGLSRTDAYREAHRRLFDLPGTHASTR